MNRIVDALRATYNFFAGDAIILGGVVLAFALGLLLVKAVHAANPVVGVVFIACIAGSLLTTLGREARGRQRGG